MEAIYRITVPGLPDTAYNREMLRLEIEIQLEEWACRYGIRAELLEEENQT